MVILPQNLSSDNGQVPGWSCILGVATAPDSAGIVSEGGEVIELHIEGSQTIPKPGI